jgi:hypothetical protein
MPHTEPRPYRTANPRFAAIKKILDENDKLLAQTKSPAAQNTNQVLRYLVETIYRLETDMIQLHGKLQPILKSMDDGSNWREWSDPRDRTPRDQGE